MLGGRGHATPENFDKNGAIWCMLNVSKYVIMNLKRTILRIINQQQQKLFVICFFDINLDVHVSTNIYI